MKALVDVTPTPEQLALFSRIRSGVEVIRGAAGSGKTTTAILKLRAAVGFYVNRSKRSNNDKKVRVLVLTFNRTLRGYVQELARNQIGKSGEIDLTVSTFASWASTLNESGREYISYPNKYIKELCSNISLSQDFLLEEVSYILGKYLEENLDDYLDSRRDGRGSVPRMERPTREKLLKEVIFPYLALKKKLSVIDWHDNAMPLINEKKAAYDVVVVDETQDFSANEIRAVMNQLSEGHTVSFVLDGAQRIYARSFTWSEVGLVVRPENSYKLVKNYRNTKQIARLAASVLDGISPGSDTTIPDFSTASREGDLPLILEGNYSSQLIYALEFIKDNVDLDSESVAFLQAKGGGWFKELRKELDRRKLGFIDLTKLSTWPSGKENIALSTMHSAKGLEFDYVFILGLNNESLPVEQFELGKENEFLQKVQRLVAMAIGRSRTNVIIGYKPEDPPVVAGFFKKDICSKVVL